MEEEWKKMKLSWPDFLFWAVAENAPTRNNQSPMITATCPLSSRFNGGRHTAISSATLQRSMGARDPGITVNLLVRLGERDEKIQIPAPAVSVGVQRDA